VRDGEQVRLTKRVACVSGERVTTINRDVFCDDRFIGEAYRETKKGKPLEVFTLNDTIPEGMVFLSGDTEHSFDSRYWGLIEVAKLNRVVPIW
jgi:conjugal transfer pilin signal peptidase TrbI